MARKYRPPRVSPPFPITDPSDDPSSDTVATPGDYKTPILGTPIISSGNISLLTLNIDGWRGAATLDELRAFFGACAPDVCIITETHLHTHGACGRNIEGSYVVVEATHLRRLSRIAEASLSLQG